MVIVGWPWILSMAKRLSGRLCVQSAQAKSSRAGAGAITFQLEPSHSAAIFEDMMRPSVCPLSVENKDLETSSRRMPDSRV